MFGIKKRREKQRRAAVVRLLDTIGFPDAGGTISELLGWPSGTRELPLSFLKQLVAPVDFGNLPRLEPEKMTALQESIDNIGVMVPVVLLADGEQVCLKDGRHRIVAATIVGATHVPATIKHTKKVSKMGVPLGELVKLIW